MAKSKLHKPRGSKTRPSRIPSSLGTTFKKKGGGSSATIDLADMFHVSCDPGKAVVQERVQYVTAYINAMRVREEAGVASSTLYEKCISLKNYLMLCDSEAVNAFSREGLKVFCDTLDEAYTAYGSRKKYLWQHEDGDPLGLKSTSCSGFFYSVVTALEMTGYPARLHAEELRDFPVGEGEPFQALSYSERDLFLRRCHEYFFQLEVALSGSASSVAPSVVDVTVDDCEWTVRRSLSSSHGDDQVSYGDPLNQFMAAGYHLLSFYTAFNDSQLCQIGREFEIDQSASKSNPKYYNLEVSKARKKGRKVKSKIGGSIEKSGRRVLETLIRVSSQYDTTEYGRLLYLKKVNGETMRFRQGVFKRNALPDVLDLTSDQTYLVAEHLVNVFMEIVVNGRRPDVRAIRRIVGSEVRSKWVNVKQPQRIAPHIAFAAVSATSGHEIDLKGIVRGLTYEILDDGLMRISFYRADGSQGNFTCDQKYRSFFEALECYSRKKVPDGSAKYPHYLIPFGGKGKNTRQWSGFAPRNLSSLFGNIGIRSGEYFVSLHSSALRETCSKAVRNSGASEYAVARFLGNAVGTSMTHYARGNPDDTERMLHEGISVLQKLSKGLALDDAKRDVASELKIDVLTIDDVRRFKGSVNANGLFCAANGGDGKRPKSHATSARRAANNGLQSKNLPCFQYQECPGCSSAKLVDDPDLIYQLLSLAEALARGAQHFPEEEERIIGASQEYKALVAANIGVETTEKAVNRIIDEGLHPLFSDVHSSARLLL